ncbi:MAG: hypothetical protein JGK29_03145 [Microcoleus sp. PH2017_17_BER_D_A]|nr:hypothetical protein [Microcoleus sp. PH2017_17_BER_D_A]MCC3545957.1 hypothetical protein [Microcoleus sp. PH2017_24_DOB_U_A]
MTFLIFNFYLLERIGLKPQAREKLKEDYSLLQSSSFQVEVALNCQLSTVNCQLSTANCQLSTANCQLSTVNCSKLLVPQRFRDWTI